MQDILRINDFVSIIPRIKVVIGRSYIRCESSKVVFDGKVKETQWTENKKEVKAFTATGPACSKIP